MRCGAGVRGGGGHPAAEGSQPQPVSTRTSGEPSRPEDLSTPEAPRGPSATSRRRRARGWGRGPGRTTAQQEQGAEGLSHHHPASAPPSSRRRWPNGPGRTLTWPLSGCLPAPVQPTPGPRCVPQPRVPGRPPTGLTPGHPASPPASRTPARASRRPEAARVSPLCKESRSRRKVTSHTAKRPYSPGRWSCGQPCSASPRSGALPAARTPPPPALALSPLGGGGSPSLGSLAPVIRGAGLGGRSPAPAAPRLQGAPREPPAQTLPTPASPGMQGRGPDPRPGPGLAV